MQRRPDKRDPGVAERTGDRLGRHSIGSGVTIRSLEIFVAVAQTGSMVAAAKRLDLTQPAISQVIAGLEASLGIGLFDRSVRPPALTLQGATLLKHAVAVTEAIGKFQSVVRGGGAGQAALVTGR